MVVVRKSKKEHAVTVMSKDFLRDESLCDKVRIPVEFLFGKSDLFSRFKKRRKGVAGCTCGSWDL